MNYRLNNLFLSFSKVKLVFIFFILLAASLALSFDLGVDEAHYMLYARYLDWSYFDHPPLVGWVHFIFNLVLGENSFSARLPAIILGLITGFGVLSFLRLFSFSKEAVVFGLIGYFFCLQFFILNLFLLPDSLQLALFWGLYYFAQRLHQQKNSIYDWFGLGLFLGFLALSKYTAIFFLVPIAMLLFQLKKMRFLTEPGFYLAVLIALVLIFPILYWNYQHDWVSFRYQLSHVTSGGAGYKGFLQSLALQFILYGPFLWPFCLVGLKKIFDIKSPIGIFILLSVIVPAVFFIKSSFQETNLPHWPALFYLLTVPVGVAVAVDSRKVYFRFFAKVAVFLSVVFMITIGGLITTGLIYKFAPPALKEVTGWKVVMQRAYEVWGQERDLNFDSKISVLLNNWTYGSRAMFYAGLIDPKFARSIIISDDRFDQFDLWNPLSSFSEKAVCISFSFDRDLVPKNNANLIDIKVGGNLVYSALIEPCSRKDQGH